MTGDPTSVETLPWSERIRFETVDWKSVPDTPGVYAIFEANRLLYVGMAGRDGKGSLRKRLQNHRNGNMVNMFKQYLWFAIVQHQQPQPVSTPTEASQLCRRYMVEYLEFSYLQCETAARAREIENQIKRGESSWGPPVLNHG